MAEERDAEAPRGVLVAAAVVVLLGVVGTAHWLDRAHRRWWKANHPFAEELARVERMGTSFRRSRENVGEAGQFAWEILSEVTGALEAERSKRH